MKNLKKDTARIKILSKTKGCFCAVFITNPKRLNLGWQIFLLVSFWMKISVSLPEKTVKAIDNVVNQGDAPLKNRSNLIALAIDEFLIRNYPHLYIKSMKGKVIKPTVLSYLKTMPSRRFKMRSPRLRGRGFHAEWIEIR